MVISSAGAPSAEGHGLDFQPKGNSRGHYVDYTVEIIRPIVPASLILARVTYIYIYCIQGRLPTAPDFQQWNSLPLLHCTYTHLLFPPSSCSFRPFPHHDDRRRTLRDRCYDHRGEPTIGVLRHWRQR